MRLLISIVGDNHLPFLELGVTLGVSRNHLPKIANASSLSINISGGFAIGTTTQRLVYVKLILLFLRC